MWMWWEGRVSQTRTDTYTTERVKLRCIHHPPKQTPSRKPHSTGSSAACSVTTSRAGMGE